MPKQNQSTESSTTKQKQQENKINNSQEQMGAQSASSGLDYTFNGPSNPTIQTQAAHLSDSRLSTLQRQAMASEIGQIGGNRYLQRVIAQTKANTANIQRKPNNQGIQRTSTSTNSNPVIQRSPKDWKWVGSLDANCYAWAANHSQPHHKKGGGTAIPGAASGYDYGHGLSSEVSEGLGISLEDYEVIRDKLGNLFTYIAAEQLTVSQAYDMLNENEMRILNSILGDDTSNDFNDLEAVKAKMDETQKGIMGEKLKIGAVEDGMILPETMRGVEQAYDPPNVPPMVEGYNIAAQVLVGGGFHWYRKDTNGWSCKDDVKPIRNFLRVGTEKVEMTDQNVGEMLAQGGDLDGYKDMTFVSYFYVPEGGIEVGSVTPDKARSEEEKPAPISDKKCFITTACVEAKGLADNCDALTTLRAFRDTFMPSLENGEGLIQTYYSIAPQIVAAIKAREDAKQILNDLYEVIEYCVAAIKDGKNRIALDVYKQMVIMLKDEFVGVGL